MKKAVVYDKWLHSLGGGEMVACSFAKYLLDHNYEVTFISGKSVSKSKIKDKLGINLDGVKFITIWSDEEAIQEITQTADLFINTTFMDYTRGVAKKNIYYTHFPTEAYHSLKSRFVNQIILPIAVKFLTPFEFLSSETPQELINGKLAYVLLPKNCIAVPHLSKKETYKIKITLYLNQFTKSALSNIKFNIENSDIFESKIIIDHFHNCIHLISIVKPLSSTIYLNLNFPQELVPNYIPLKYYLINIYAITVKIPPYLVKLLEQKISLRLRAGIFSNIIQRLDSYDLICANSQFTAKWIHKYWKKNSSLLYPPVRLITSNVPLSKRTKRIVSIGRFFTLGHGKKQEVLIEAFKELQSLEGYRNWELHLMGGVGDEPTSIEFVQNLQKLSIGYPIYFHLNSSRESMMNILADSQIYWHATGYGESDSHPVKFEHFGIAPVEAISAGCVPLLYNGGGLPEIITATGLPTDFIFSSIDALVNKTKKVISEIDKNKYLDIAKNAKVFSYESFTDRLNHILDEI